MTMKSESHPENRYCINIADAVRRSTTTELQHRILQMESAASPEALRTATYRMLQADRDLVRAIGG